jgi:hypothetical protein
LNNDLGAQTIKLIVSSDGCTSAPYTLVVNPIPSVCHAVIQEPTYSWCDSGKEVSIPIQFHSLSTYTSCPVKFTWDFGDNTPLSNAENPTHTYVHPTPGQQFTVKLTVTTGQGNDLCTDVATRVLTLRPFKADLTYKICCDGRVDFYNTNAVGGRWEDYNEPKRQNLFNLQYHHWPFTDYKLSDASDGDHHYWQYYDAGVHTITLQDAKSADGNVCPLTVRFTVPPLACLSRNDHLPDPWSYYTVTLNGTKIQLKFRQVQNFGLYPKLKAKIRSPFFRRFKNASVSITGTVFFKDADGCYCNLSNTVPSAVQASTSNRSKAQVEWGVTDASGNTRKFRTKDPSIQAHFDVELKNGDKGHWDLNLGDDCDLPKHPEAFWN